MPIILTVVWKLEDITYSAEGTNISEMVQDRDVLLQTSEKWCVTYQVVLFPKVLSDFRVVYLLQAFPNAVFHTVVQTSTD